MRFSELNLISPILAAADEAGYTQPSPIQQKAIPPILSGRDLLGCAQTGTGKTAAFAMPILQLVYSRCRRDGAHPIRALVLTPTRELALQIDESFAAYGARLPVRHAVIFGGVGQALQVEKLKAGVDVLTATPGRLNDLIDQGHVNLSSLEIFVLDEADCMLDMGFVNDVRKVLRHLPKKRQTLLFSATMPREIEQLAAGILRDPVQVMVTPPATTVEAIQQSVCFVDKANKKHLLASFLKDGQITSALVFTRTKHGADRVVRDLAKAGIQAAAIHGNKSQSARQSALSRFKSGQIRVLVATDIAARGIDVSGLSHVFNYDLPNVPETYVHRIGRTGRAGAQGVAVSFCCADEMEYLRDIEKLTRQHIPVCGHAWPMQEGTAPSQTQQRPQNRKEKAGTDPSGT
ncbi:DEAD/DEAH box helicase, partial [uncultured Ruthenibacterium sp.]|uniref:DEAD/DEAH box helicase n=1 Tax=uncultured Ruthenibacterium sp. TaxID=1905347 RepID=UPI00349EB5EF